MYDYFTQVNEYLENSAKKHPEKLGLICGNKQFTYQDINGFANKFCNYLLAYGIKRGDRVVISTGNRFETVIGFWGTLKAGAVVSIISPDTSDQKLKYIIDDSDASLLFCSKLQYESLPKDLYKINTTIKGILLLEDLVEQTAMLDQFSTVMSHFPTDYCRSKALDIDLASIIYTSGSTGEPKGVMLTHRNMLAASTSINTYLKHSENDSIISVLPLSFDYGLYQMIMAFSVGATLLLEENFIWPAQLLKKIALHKVTVLPVVPTMVSLLAQHNKIFPYDLSSIRAVTNTGAALNVKHIDILKSIFNCAEIFSMYGLTECKRCTYLPPNMINKKPTSVGIAIPNTELFVVDEHGNALKSNEVGQLVIRGATVMKGYWKKEKQTQEKLKDGPLPHEKLLFTGDYCWLDDDGFLYFHGRMDEVLKCKGMKVSPKEVEEILMRCEYVSEAAIVGIDDLEYGTAICAYIVPVNDTNDTVIKDFCHKHLSSEKLPKYLSFVKSLPKTGNGKINKLELKALAKNTYCSEENTLAVNS